MPNEQFHSDINKMFESHLAQGSTPKIFVKQGDVILTQMKYEKVFFDKDLNIFKLKSDGTLEKVTNPSFSAVVISQ